MSDFFWFSDEQWARIEPLLPTDTRGMARRRAERALHRLGRRLLWGSRRGEGRRPGPGGVEEGCYGN